MIPLSSGCLISMVVPKPPLYRDTLVTVPWNTARTVEPRGMTKSMPWWLVEHALQALARCPKSEDILSNPASTGNTTHETVYSSRWVGVCVVSFVVIVWVSMSVLFSVSAFAGVAIDTSCSATKLIATTALCIRFFT